MTGPASGHSAAPPGASAACRSAREVLDDHLQKSQYGCVEADLAHNYAPDIVVLAGDGVYRGYEGMRKLAQRLRDELPNAVFEYRTVLVEEDVGFLEWSGHGGNAHVHDGADSFVIRDGKIVAQTIHYTVERGR